MQAVANLIIIHFNAGCGKLQHYFTLMQAVANFSIIHFNAGCGKPHHYSF
jgi:hypothetical protein